MAVRRDADKYHVGLDFVQHGAIIDIGLTGTGPARKLLCAADYNVAKSCKLNIFELKEVVKVVAANTTATDHRKFLHFGLPL
jgi:shikimate kinase